VFNAIGKTLLSYDIVNISQYTSISLSDFKEAVCKAYEIKYMVVDSRLVSRVYNGVWYTTLN